MRPAIRFLPSLLVATLLVLVARAQPAVPRAPQPAHVPAVLAVLAVPAAPLQLATQCPPPTLCPTIACQSAPVTSLVNQSPGVVLVQPFNAPCVVSASAFYVSPSTQPVNFIMRYGYFDPQAQNPFGATFPLDVYRGTATSPGWMMREFGRPIVVHEVEGVAQTYAATLRVASCGTIEFEQQVDAGRSPTEGTTLAVAYQVTPVGAQPLPGPDNALAHDLCVAAIDEQQRRVLQQVLRVTTPVPSTPTAELVQSFVAPVTATAEWVELAIASLPPTFPPMEVSILDPGTLTVPPPGPMPVTATSATLDAAPGSLTVPAWVPTLKLSQPASLEAGKTYWLAVKTSNQWGLAADGSGGSGDPQGRMFVRGTQTSSWTEDQGKDLSFRLIGLRSYPPDPLPVTCTAGVVASQVTATATVLVYPGRRIAQNVTATAMMPIGSSSFLVQHQAPDQSEWPLIGMAFTHPAGEDPDDGTFLMSAHQVSPTPRSFITVAHRPLVSTHVSATASAPGPGLVYVFRGRSSRALEVLDFSDAEVPQRVGRIELAQGCFEPLPGSHPVLTFQACAASDPDAPILRAVQQFLPVNAPVTATMTAEAVQTFQVPEACRVDWVELAVPAEQGQAAPLEVAVYEPATGEIPGAEPLPVTFTASTLPAPTATARVEGEWMGTLRFTNRPVLQPGKTYWLMLRAQNQWALGASSVTVTAYTGGQLFVRSQPTKMFEEDTGRDLSFRLIGVPLSLLVGVAPGPSPALSLTVTSGPNPFRASHALRWSGGAGPAEVEIMDLASRRVRWVARAGEARAGAWLWRGEDDGGRSLPAGVYYVRVRDGAGRVATSSVVLMR